MGEELAFIRPFHYIPLTLSIQRQTFRLMSLASDFSIIVCCPRHGVNVRWSSIDHTHIHHQNQNNWLHVCLRTVFERNEHELVTFTSSRT